MPKKDVVGPVRPSLDNLALPFVRDIRSALKNMDWSPIPNRPGRYHRAVEFNGVYYVEKCWCCVDCATMWPTVFHMENLTWQDIADPNEILCLICAAKRLGRPLRPDDLPAAVPVNREFRYLLVTREPK